MKSRFLFAIVVTFAATACSGVKNLMPPQLDLPEELAGNSVDSATLADVEWWKMYPDSSLVHIIRETIDHNRDLAAAAARVEQMRQLYGVKLYILPGCERIHFCSIMIYKKYNIVNESVVNTNTESVNQK